MKSESEVTQPCPTLSDPMDCSLPGSSVHGIFQARVLEWVAIAFYVEKYCQSLDQRLSAARSASINDFISTFQPLDQRLSAA